MSAAAACSDPAAQSASSGGAEQPAGFDAELALPVAADKNPDPAVLEIDLVARVADVPIRDGTLTPVWSYDGGLPGPLIRAKRGDRVIVHFSNRLPEPTTIHWHGLRIPAEMDGVPDHPRPPIAPGETFDYDFVVPDAGTFWYHPHVNSAQQVGDGLYGAMVVEDPAEPALGDEVVLVLSDIALTADGSLQPADAGGSIATLFGREGNVLLVNGKQRPTLKARPGKAQRWRLVNTAKSRYFELALEGHTFTRVGGDGGLIEHPVESERVVLAPGERADVIVVPRDDRGERLVIRWVPYDRGYGSTYNRPEEELFYLELQGEPVVDAPLPELRRVIEPTNIDGATPVELRLTRNQDGGPLVLGINDVPYWDAEPISAHLGETQVWTVVNETEWSHPFHLHGFFFQVLGADGAPVQPMEWKDTVDVPYEKALKLAVRYDERPGMWMFHCHILDHADAGMMGMLHVAGH